MSQSGAPYAGDVTPNDAWADLEQNASAALVDVRTSAEWSFVGVPDLSGLSRSAIHLEWQSYPTMAIDTTFVDRLEQQLKSSGASHDAPIYFLCRSGARSQSAAIAMTARGWSRCYNVVGGFEGPLGPDRHRGSTAGWKADGLPWRQS